MASANHAVRAGGTWASTQLTFPRHVVPCTNQDYYWSQQYVLSLAGDDILLPVGFEELLSFVLGSRCFIQKLSARKAAPDMA